MDLISIIIPSRNDPWLQKTVTGIFEAAHATIEVIVVLDGYWPDPILEPKPNLTIIHRSQPLGMRSAINSAARIAKGNYLMKCDAHCFFDNGFDEKLLADCADNWLVVPRRYDLDQKTWQRGDKLTDYMYISPPPEFKGRPWNLKDRDDKLIDDLMTFQGSCWFMPKALFEKIGGEDEVNYGTSGKEAQELCCKVWLSGGRVVRNKKTWYAHLHFPRTYSLPPAEREKSRLFAIDCWTNNKWSQQTRNFEWLLNKFNPPGWKHKAKTVAAYLEEKFNVQTNLLPVKIKGFNRRHLAEMFAYLGFTKGAEIGVGSGKNAYNLCSRIPDLHLICIDPWRGYAEYLETSRGVRHLEETKKRLNGFNVTYLQKMSLEALSDVEDGSLDFVYIDANHAFDYVVQDIIAWSKKVREGGVVSGHDYNPGNKRGVVEAVDAYTKAHSIKPWYLDDERATSWFWVK